MNYTILTGRICRNLELRKTQSGMSVCNVTLAIPRNYKNSEGIYESDFITCVCYRQVADMISTYCKKGDMIGIHGMVQSRSYEKDGKKVYTTEIVVDKVNFLSQAKKEEKVEVTKEETTDAFAEFSKEADLSDIGIDDESLPF